MQDCLIGSGVPGPQVTHDGLMPVYFNARTDPDKRAGSHAHNDSWIFTAATDIPLNDGFNDDQGCCNTQFQNFSGVMRRSRTGLYSLLLKLERLAGFPWFVWGMPHWLAYPKLQQIGVPSDLNKYARVQALFSGLGAGYQYSWYPIFILRNALILQQYAASSDQTNISMLHDFMHLRESEYAWLTEKLGTGSLQWALLVTAAVPLGGVLNYSKWSMYQYCWNNITSNNRIARLMRSLINSCEEQSLSPRHASVQEPLVLSGNSGKTEMTHLEQIGRILQNVAISSTINDDIWLAYALQNDLMRNRRLGLWQDRNKDKAKYFSSSLQRVYRLNRGLGRGCCDRLFYFFILFKWVALCQYGSFSYDLAIYKPMHHHPGFNATGHNATRLLMGLKDADSSYVAAGRADDLNSFLMLSVLLPCVILLVEMAGSCALHSQATSKQYCPRLPSSLWPDQSGAAPVGSSSVPVPSVAVNPGL